MPLFTRRAMLGALSTLAGSVTLPALTAAPPADSFDIRQYGAIGDNATINTAAIQKAIDAAAVNGGTVLIAGGTYRTGTLFLRSNITVWMESGATLIGSPDIADYPTGTHHNMYAGETYMDRCFIFAKDAANISLEGEGVIDGSGHSFPNPNDPTRSKPMMLRMLNCRNITMRGLTLQMPAGWSTAFLYCNDVRVDNVNVSSKGISNGDGLDFDGCQDVRVSNCRLDTGDDSISLQSSDAEKPVRNVLISNCIMSSRWAAIRIGLLSRGDFENIVVSNCVFHDILGEAIKIQMAEGGRMNNLIFSDIAMRDVPRPVFVTFNSFRFATGSPRETPPMRSLRNLTFSNMRIESSPTSADPRFSFMSVLGLPGFPVENVTFSNIFFTAPGGGTAEDAAPRNVPELANIRPERKPLGTTLPAWGVYARHVRGLRIDNVDLRTATADARPAMVCDDVESLSVSGSSLNARWRDVKDGTLRNSSALPDTGTFLSLEGNATRDILVTANDARHAKRLIDRAAEIPATAVIETANLH